MTKNDVTIAADLSSLAMCKFVFTKCHTITDSWPCTRKATCKHCKEQFIDIASTTSALVRKAL